MTEEDETETYPQHERLKEVSKVTQGIHDFCELLAERGIELTRWVEGDGGFFMPVGTPARDDLMAESVGIDREALEAEKRQMIAGLRK